MFHLVHLHVGVVRAWHSDSFFHTYVRIVRLLVLVLINEKGATAICRSVMCGMFENLLLLLLLYYYYYH